MDEIFMTYTLGEVLRALGPGALVESPSRSLSSQSVRVLREALRVIVLIEARENAERALRDSFRKHRAVAALRGTAPRADTPSDDATAPQRKLLSLAESAPPPSAPC
jgi:hypothetical protein